MAQTNSKSSIRPMLNLLLLGKSGVGKSTFINSFANYAAYSDISEIKNCSDVKAPIPAKFVLCDASDNEIVFQVGEERNTDNNESLKPTSSGTRGCKSYMFDFGNVTINLIDTPGIVDTNGVEQDKQNLEGILEFISHFKSIDGICMLLKPNEPKLDPVFRYCVYTILCQLEKSAAENMIFVFTNSRSTLFQLGSTKTVMKEMLQSIKEDKPDLDIKFDAENSFKFDSESFQFLLAKDEFNFSDEERSTFVQSWNKSRNECVRMVKYISGLPSHDVENTISIFRARKLIESLLGPLKFIAANIAENEEKCRSKETEIINCKDDISKLKNNLYIPRTKIEMEYFNLPRFVCCSPKCVTKVMVDGVEQIHYGAVCLQGEQINMAGLLQETWGALSAVGGAGAVATVVSSLVAAPLVGGIAAVAILGAGTLAGTYYYKTGLCPSCGCNISDHAPSTFETKQVEERIENPSAFAELLTATNSTEIAQKFLDGLYEELHNLQEERKAVNHANIVFASFLKHHSITVYNDAYDNYLDYLIQGASSSNTVDGTTREFHLMGLKDEYRQQKQAYEKAIQESAASSTYGQGEKISAVEIDNIVGKLCRLERYGTLIQEAIRGSKVLQENVKLQRIQPVKISCMESVGKAENFLKTLFDF